MRLTRPLPTLILALALSACAHEAQRAADPGCNNAARAALAARGVDVSTITSMLYNEMRATETRAVEDRNVWVRSSTCRGYLVARVDAGCNVTELYTVGDCLLPARG